MSRTSNITYGQVAEIADTMKAAGTRPTARAVRKRIGSGSMGTIHRLLSQWAGTTPAEEAQALELPAAIAEALMDFVSTEVATACEPLVEQIREHQAAAADLATENERLAAIIEQLEQERDEAESARATLAGTLAAVEKSLDERILEAVKARDYAEEQRHKIIALTIRNNELEAIAAKVDPLERSNAALATQYTNADKERAVLTARLEAAQAQAKEYSERAAKTNDDMAAIQLEARNQHQVLQACTAALDAAQKEITSLRTELKACKSKPTAKKPTAKPTKEAV